MRRWLLLLPLLLLTHSRADAELTKDHIQTGPYAEVEAALPREHPAAYYAYAARLFHEGRGDDAVFWFYAGQLRYRFHLLSNPNLPADQDPAAMASLNAMVGQYINEYAGGDPTSWVAQIDRILEWDAKTDNGFTSKQAHKAEWDKIRTGLVALRDMVERDADKIREQRAEAGLPNR